MNDKSGGAAFPSPGIVLDFSLGQTQQGAYEGMTLRDYCAAKALMGMMASRNDRSPRFSPEDDATYVYQVADAMLVAREVK